MGRPKKNRAAEDLETSAEASEPALDADETEEQIPELSEEDLQSVQEALEAQSPLIAPSVVGETLSEAAVAAEEAKTAKESRKELSAALALVKAIRRDSNSPARRELLSVAIACIEEQLK